MMNLMFYKLIQLLKYYQLEKYDKKIIYGIEIRKITGTRLKLINNLIK